MFRAFKDELHGLLGSCTVATERSHGDAEARKSGCCCQTDPGTCTGNQRRASVEAGGGGGPVGQMAAHGVADVAVPEDDTAVEDTIDRGGRAHASAYPIRAA